jgi:hypothetical protein
VRVEPARQEGAAVEVQDRALVAAAEVADPLGLQPLAGRGRQVDRSPHRALVDGQQLGRVLDQVGREDVERQVRPQSQQRADGVPQREAESLGAQARAAEVLGLGSQ